MLVVNAASIMMKDLTFLEVIGQGGSGCVWKGEWVPQSKVVAIKSVVNVSDREVSFSLDICFSGLALTTVKMEVLL